MPRRRARTGPAGAGPRAARGSASPRSAGSAFRATASIPRSRRFRPAGARVGASSTRRVVSPVPVPSSSIVPDRGPGVRRHACIGLEALVVGHLRRHQRRGRSRDPSGTGPSAGPPLRGEHPAPVVPARSPRSPRSLKPARASSSSTFGMPGRVAELGRDRRAVEVRAERDVLDADPVGDVARVPRRSARSACRCPRRSRGAGTGTRTRSRPGRRWRRSRRAGRR